MKTAGHECPECFRVWASNNCWNGGYCHGSPIQCPVCVPSDILGAQYERWNYADDIGKSVPQKMYVDGDW